MNNTLFLPGLLLFLSYLLTYVIREYSNKRKLLDIPNERSSHSIPVPRGGGLAIVVSWYTGISILYFYGQIPANLYFALLCGVMIAVVSFIDDLFTVKPGIRLLIQGVCVLITLFILRIDVPLELNDLKILNSNILFPLAVIGMLWFINLFNFLDGIDGYASLEAITVAMILFVITGNNITVLFISCVAGFLIWNWPKARIFMGDIGSTQLGFILFVFAIYFHGTGELHIIHWIMLTSLFWFDATLTLYRRFRNGEKLSVAHRKHAYQRIVQAGFSHKKTVLCSVLINSIIFLLVIISLRFESMIIPMFVVNLILLYTISLAVDRKLPFQYNPSK